MESFEPRCIWFGYYAQKGKLDEEIITLRWHRFFSDGARFPHGFTGSANARFDSLPTSLKKRVQTGIATMAGVIEEREQEVWIRLGITSVLVYSISAMVYDRAAWENTPDDVVSQSCGLSIEYHRAKETGIFPGWWNGALIYGAGKGLSVSVNMGDHETYVDDEGKKKWVIGLVRRFVDIGTEVSKLLEGGKSVQSIS